MKIFQFNSELHKVTGVQKVLMDIHHAVKDKYDAKIVGAVVLKDVPDKCIVEGVSAKMVKV